MKLTTKKDIENIKGLMTEFTQDIYKELYKDREVEVKRKDNKLIFESKQKRGIAVQNTKTTIQTKMDENKYMNVRNIEIIAWEQKEDSHNVAVELQMEGYIERNS